MSGSSRQPRRRSLVREPPRHLLGEERVPARALGDRRDRVGARRRRRRSSASTSSRVSLDGERVEQDRGRVVAARRPSRCGARAARRARGRAASAGPRTHWARYSIRSSIPWSAQWMSSNTRTSGLAAGHRLDHGAHRREEALAHALRVVALGLGDVDRRLDAEQARRSRPPGAPPAPPARCPSTPSARRSAVEQLLPGLLGAVAVHDPGLGADHLAQRPVDDSRAVGQAAALAEGGRRVALARASARARAAGATCRRRPARSPSPGAAGARARPARRPIAAARACRRGRPAGSRRAGDAADRLRGEHADRLPGGHGLGLALQASAAPARGTRSPRGSRGRCARPP